MQFAEYMMGQEHLGFPETHDMPGDHHWPDYDWFPGVDFFPSLKRKVPLSTQSLWALLKMRCVGRLGYSTTL